MEQLSVEDWKPDACPKNITVEEYLATFPKIKLTRREYLQTLPLYHAALYLAETTQKVHSSQEWYLYLNEKVDQNGEVLIDEYDVSETNQKETEEAQKKHYAAKRRPPVLPVHVTGWRFYIQAISGRASCFVW